MRLLTNLKKYKNDTAITIRNNYISYGDLDKLSDKLAKKFNKKKLGFLICENEIESILFYLSSLKNKCALVLLEKNITEINLNSLIQKYEPKYIFKNKKNNIKCKNFTKREIFLNYLIYENKNKLNINIHKNLKILISTSGTTGNPKYVKLSEKNLSSNIESVINYLKLNKYDSTITTLPMNYVYGLSIINTHLFVGAKIILNDFSVIDKRFWELISKHKITNINGVSYLYEIMDKIKFLDKNLSYVQFFTHAGGKINKQLQKKLIDFCIKNKKKIFFMYGAAEATARMSYVPWEYAKKKIGSIGIPIKGGRFWLENKKKQKIIQKNKIGELFYSGKNVFSGYANNFQDLSTIDNLSILRTGDFAKKDKDGFYFLSGRSDKFVKIQGNRLNLEDIETYTYNFGVKSVCKLNKQNKISIFIEKDIDERMLLNEIKKRVTVHPSNFIIKKIKKFPLNKNFKISYNDKIFD